MKLLSKHTIYLCVALANLATAAVIEIFPNQKHLFEVDIMTTTEITQEVPGNSDVKYGPVPREDQLFSVEFFDVAPTPLVVSKILFGFLRGWVPSTTIGDSARLNERLETATLTMTRSAEFPDGTTHPAGSVTFPLRTTTLADLCHLSIRNETGAYVEYLTTGRNDILVDFIIPGLFHRTGTWTFEALAQLEDGTCLFAYTLTQSLEGIPRLHSG